MLKQTPEQGQEQTITFTVKRFCQYCGITVGSVEWTWPASQYEKAKQFGDLSQDHSAICQNCVDNPPHG
jgi:hypothetical protein